MQTNILTLSPVESRLNNLTLYEPINVQILDKLINSDLLKVTFHNPLCAGYENEKHYLLCYKKLIKQGKAVVKYTRAKDMQSGRVNPVKAQGLFSIRREIRHTLCKGTFVDIDIENCHPVLLLQICQKHEIQCKYLSKYVHKRDKYLTGIMEHYGTTRDEAKKLFIRLMYFGSFDNWMKDIPSPTNTNELTFLKKFKLELQNIGNLIMNANPELMKAILSKKKPDCNIIGSVCSYYLQEYENRILEAVYLYCVENKYIVDSVGVLCADGLMVEEQYFKPSLLEELVEVVDKSLGFKVKFTTKEFNQDYLSLLKPVETASKIDEYTRIKNCFELTNFKVLNPIMFVTVGENNELLLRSKRDFKDVYQNLVYSKIKEDTDSVTTVSFIDSWLVDPSMRTYYKLDFLPMKTAPANIYNTFSGYEAEKKALFPVDIDNSLIIKHIKNLCNNDDNVFNYVIKYFARKLQRPYELTNTALIFKSNEGAGKDLFFNYLGNKILGSDYYFNTEKPELLFGKFTSSLENKILIVVNETSGKDTFQINENIKCAITADFNTIEHKGLKPYKNTNHIGYIYLTNNDNPVKVPVDDRRFCGIECNNLICNNKIYFDELRSEINSGKFDKAFYNYLMNINTDNYDFTNERPKTNFYNDLQEMNKPTLIIFLEQFISKNTDDVTIEVPSNVLFTEFNDFVNKFNFKCVISLTKFIMDLKKIDGIDTKITKTARYILFDKQNVKSFLTTKYAAEFCEIAEDEADEKISDLDV